MEKPLLNEVLKYATKQLHIYINRFSSTLPLEQREEMSQTGLLRVIEIYEKLDPSMGWKSYIQRHCHGAVLDYIRWGAGFEEQTLKSDDNETEEKKPWRLKSRVKSLKSKQGESIEKMAIDTILGSYGVFHDAHDLTEFQPKWDLISRMASQDVDIHLVAKLLLGFTQTELSSMFKVSRERLTQRFQEFCKRLDSPEFYNSKWIIQTIFAFGLCHRFQQPEHDLGYGWEHDPVDLWSTDINYIENLNPQMVFEFNYN